MRERFREFTLLISKINRSIRRLKAEEMAGFELKLGHLSCIYYLHTMGPMSAGELCSVCEEDKASVSRSIEFLEKSGYITIAAAENKKYKRPIALTEKGAQIGRYLDEKTAAVFEASGSGLTADERETMYRALHMISDKLQAICEEYDA